MIDKLKPLIGKLCSFSQKRLGFSHPPKLFLKSDMNNAQNALGKTAYYDPQEQSITLFFVGRHPKDILRSFSHELVHHAQNLRGDLAPEKMTKTGPNYAQECPHMRNMEKEAYLKGNMCFRDWEDTLDNKDIYIIKIAESKFLKENKTMTTKITKELLKDMIISVLTEQVEENTDIDEGHCNTPTAGKREKKKYLEEEELEESEGPEELEEVEQLEEKRKCCPKGTPGCPGVGKKGKDDPKGVHKGLFESEGLEEKKGKKKSKAKGKVPKTEKERKFAKLAPPKDKITFADKIAGATQVAESKVQTPEQENALYEQRFTPKNNRLFEKLLKEWTK